MRPTARVEDAGRGRRRRWPGPAGPAGEQRQVLLVHLGGELEGAVERSWPSSALPAWHHVARLDVARHHQAGRRARRSRVSASRDAATARAASACASAATASRSSAPPGRGRLRRGRLALAARHLERPLGVLGRLARAAPGLAERAGPAPRPARPGPPGARPGAAPRPPAARTRRAPAPAAPPPRPPARRAWRSAAAASTSSSWRRSWPAATRSPSRTATARTRPGARLASVTRAGGRTRPVATTRCTIGARLDQVQAGTSGARSRRHGHQAATSSGDGRGGRGGAARWRRARGRRGRGEGRREVIGAPRLAPGPTAGCGRSGSSRPARPAAPVGSVARCRAEASRVEDDGRWVFNRLAGDYARAARLPGAAGGAAPRALAGGPRARVAELGAGHRPPLAAAGRGPGASVHAVEPARAMLAVLGRRRRPAPGDAGPRRGRGDRPARPAAFDLVVLADALHWIDAEAAGREVARLLRPGGVAAVVEVAARRHAVPGGAGRPASPPPTRRRAPGRPRSSASWPSPAPGAAPRHRALPGRGAARRPDGSTPCSAPSRWSGPALGPAGLAALLAEARRPGRRPTAAPSGSRELAAPLGAALRPGSRPLSRPAAGARPASRPAPPAAPRRSASRWRRTAASSRGSRERVGAPGLGRLEAARELVLASGAALEARRARGRCTRRWSGRAPR